MPLKALIAYADFPAVRRAMSAINDAIRVSPWTVDFTPMLWRFDQLATGGWHEHSLADAAEAHVVVLASSEPGALSAAVENWIGKLLARRRRACTTIVALLGAQDAWTISVEPTAESSGPAPSRPVAPEFAGLSVEA